MKRIWQLVQEIVFTIVAGLVGVGMIYWVIFIVDLSKNLPWGEWYEKSFKILSKQWIWSYN